MKKVFVLSIMTLAVITSCKTKSSASTASSDTKSNAPTKELTAVEYAKGKELFESSCGKCHDLPKPKAYSAEEWVGIMKAMAPKAKMNEAQSTLVYDYVTTYKK